MFNRTMVRITAIILLAFCSFVYGQEKQKIAFIFVGEEPRKGTFKPFSSQMQMATMKKYAAEDRTAEFRKLVQEGNEAQVYKAVSQWGVKHIIFIEMSEVMEGYHLETKMMNVENSEIVKIIITESRLENSKDMSIAAQEIAVGLFEFSENSSSSASNISYETITDPRDNQSYETIKIGNLRWMAKNMNYKTDKSWCYDDDDYNCKRYGRLYDWHTAMKVCPSGWKLPSRSEWNDLVQAVGKEVAGKKLKSRDVQGTDDFGFSASLGGRRNVGGSFNYLREDGRWWTSTTTPEGSNAYYQYMNIRMDYTDENLRPNDFSNGYSVRCVMGSSQNIVTDMPESTTSDASNNSSSEKLSNILIDSRDGKKYKIVEIGILTWMAQNLNYKTGESLCYDADDLFCDKYGRLYDWNTAKKACPSGWHLPKKSEWEDLVQTVDDKKVAEKTSSKTTAVDVAKEVGSGNYLRAVGKFFEIAASNDQPPPVGKRVAGENIVAGQKLKSQQGYGTDDFGFSALMGGGKGGGKFHSVYKAGFWWTATESDSNKAHEIYIHSDKNYVGEESSNKADNSSVRCVKDRK